MQGALKGEVWLTSCLTDLDIHFALGALNFVLHRGTFLNRSNRRSTVQWYFPFECSLHCWTKVTPTQILTIYLSQDKTI